MITEDYVSFETAKLLKEKGFNEKCTHYYKNKKYLVDLGYTNIHSYTNSDLVEEFAAPTLQMARKWLEEVHGIHLNIIYNKICDKGYWGKGHWTWNNEEYSSYEEACEVAIKYCLKNII